MISYLIKLRELFINNFNVSIYLININKTNYYFNKSQIFFKIIPFSIIKFINSYTNNNIIYKIDNIYYITNTQYNTILPIIFNMSVYNDINYKKCITSNIKYFMFSIPFDFILKNLNIEHYEYLYIKYMHNGKIIEKSILINETKHLLLYNIFN